MKHLNKAAIAATTILALVPLTAIAESGFYIGGSPDGNGIEVYYETPRSEWYRQEKLFMHGDRPEVHFPGPWEKELVPDGVAAKS